MAFIKKKKTGTVHISLHILKGSLNLLKTFGGS